MLDLFILTTGIGGTILLIHGLIQDHFMTTTPTSLQTKSLTLLADGFAADFVDYVLQSEEYVELLHSLVYDFISENIPLNDDDLKFELGMMLLERTRLFPTTSDK